MTDQPYKLNLQHGSTLNVLHRHPSFENCNADAFDSTVYLDKGGAKEVIANGSAQWCRYCRPIENVDQANSAGSESENDADQH